MPCSPLGLPRRSAGSGMPRASPLPCHNRSRAAGRCLRGSRTRREGPRRGQDRTLLSSPTAWRRAQGQLKLLQAPLAKPLSTLSYGCSPQAASLLLEVASFVTDIAYPAASHLCPELLVLSWHSGTAVLNARCPGQVCPALAELGAVCCVESCSPLHPGARVTHRSSQGGSLASKS